MKKCFKKTLALMLSLIMLMSVMPMTNVFAADIIASGSMDSGENTWTLDSDGVLTISGSREINNNQSFLEYKDDIEKVVIEEGIPSIYYSVFQDFTNLKSVVLPESLTKIYDGVFSGCTALESANMPSGIKAMGSRIFEDCSSLKNIYLAEGLEAIGNRMFGECVSLEEITIPESVNTIGWGAFDGCKNIKSLHIPAGVTEISGRIARFSPNIETFTVDENNENYSSEGGALFNKDKTVLLEFIASKGVKEYTPAESVKTIAKSAFEGNLELETVVLGDNIEEVGECAFIHCLSLKNVTIPSNAKTEMTTAFYICPNLENICIPEGVEELSLGIFACSFSLESISFPGSLKKIGDNAFLMSTSLKELDFPESVEEIGEEAFLCCCSLENITVRNRTLDLDASGLGFDVFDFETKAEADEFNKINKRLYELVIKMMNHCSTDEEEKEFEAIEEIIESFEETEEWVASDWMTVSGYRGSTANTYADTNGFRFIPLDPEVHEHNYESTITKEPTYNEVGVRTYTCSCGDTYTEEIPMIEAGDKNTGVFVVYPDHSFDSDIQVVANHLKDDETNAKLLEIGYNKAVVYDISIYADGQPVQPNGRIWIKIPAPEGFNKKNCSAYYIPDEGKPERVKSYYEDGYIYIETDHFSKYAIVEEEAQSTPDESTPLASLYDMIAAIRNFFRWLGVYIKSLFK